MTQRFIELPKDERFHQYLVSRVVEGVCPWCHSPLGRDPEVEECQLGFRGVHEVRWTRCENCNTAWGFGYWTDDPTGDIATKDGPGLVAVKEMWELQREGNR